MAPPKRFTIREGEKENWGNLVKAWAKGEKECPKNVTELRAHCAEFGVQPEIPDFITGIVFVQNDKHVLTVRLPPKELIVQGEVDIQQSTGAYPLPNFYTDFFSQATPREDLTARDRLRLQSCRVGEYSVNSCA